MTKTKAELRQAHGTPVQFRRAVNKAIAQGTVGITEGQAAVLKYNCEYATAPDEHGMIFTGESVSGIMARTKTMTRRIINPQLPPDRVIVDHNNGQITVCLDDQTEKFPGPYELKTWKCPYGVVGDQLWVRETWRTEERASDMVDGVLFQDGTFRPIEDSGAAAILWIDAHANGKYGDDWRSAMFMPRWASRLTLEITGIRVERLQDISEEDAVEEGCLMEDGFPKEQPHSSGIGLEGWDCARDWFADKWDEINSKRASFESNPFVWVISFKVIDRHPIPSI